MPRLDHARRDLPETRPRDWPYARLPEAHDILLPFAAYFLLVMCEDAVPPLRSWFLKTVTAFAVISCAEVAQYFGKPIFGRTYDPWDFAAYAAGALLAASTDRVLFPRIFGSWADGSGRATPR